VENAFAVANVGSISSMPLFKVMVGDENVSQSYTGVAKNAVLGSHT
jgi:hypothetical protein